MKKSILLLILGCLACSTSQKKEDKLSEDEMVQLLAEIHLAESQVNAMHFGSTDSSIVVYHALEQQIFRAHGIDSLRFKISYDAYVRDPILLGKVYNRVTVKLKQEAKVLMKLPKKSK